MEIVANNGKTYKDLRAYHIALGMAVRQALINFSKEVEDYCQKLISDFYGEYNPEYYERSYQLEEKMRLGELIKMSIRGNFEENYHLEYNLFDWQVLDSIDNGYGQFGTYMSFDKTDVRDEMEMFMRAGIIKGHEPLNLYDLVDKYVSEHLDDRIQKVLNEF
jgi:hypothetical protein